MGHTHKYQRDKLGKSYIIYRCALIDCRHYLAANIVTGRLSLCWKCEAPFVMTKKSAQLTKPHCASPSCHKITAKVRSVDEEGIERILKGL